MKRNKTKRANDYKIVNSILKICIKVGYLLLVVEKVVDYLR